MTIEKNTIANTVFGIIIAALLCAAPVRAAEPAPSCIAEKIDVEKLKQQNAQLIQQLMQAQYQASDQAAKAAKAEQERLEALLPKQPVTGPEKK